MNAYTKQHDYGKVMLLGTQVQFMLPEKKMCDTGVQCDLIGCHSSTPEPEIVSDSGNDGSIAVDTSDESDYGDQKCSQTSSLSDMK